MLRQLDEELKTILEEGETGEKLKEQFRGVAEFTRLTGYDWVDLGVKLKELGATKSVFTKAFGNFLRFLRYGGTLPISPAEFQKFVTDNGIKLTGWVKTCSYPPGDAVLGTLESDGLMLSKGIGYVPTQKMKSILGWFESKGVDFTKKSWE